MPNGLVPFVTGFAKGLTYEIERRKKKKEREEERKKEERRHAVDLLFDLVSKGYRPEEAYGTVKQVYPEVATGLAEVVGKIPGPEELWERQWKRKKKEVKAAAALKREMEIEDLETAYGFIDKLYGDNPQVAAAMKRYVASSKLLGIKPTVKQQIDKDTGAVIQTVDLVPGVLPPSVQVIVPKEIVALKEKAKKKEEVRKRRKLRQMLEGVQDILQRAVGAGAKVTVKQQIDEDGNLEVTYTTQYAPPAAAVAGVERSHIEAMADVLKQAQDETTPIDPLSAASIIASRGDLLIDTYIRYGKLPPEEAVRRGATVTRDYLRALEKYYLAQGNAEAAGIMRSALSAFLRRHGIELPLSSTEEAPIEGEEEWLRDLMEAAGETWKELERRFGK
ncbi:MAG: hypothetical protein DRN40_04480 [Thermoplasmata archaeon]|nr:MAG: hypothetical protein DRN40_04480 [Thermoplasmata archaeon]